MVFSCGECGRDFPSRFRLSEHLLVHSKERIACRECNQTYSNVANMLRHVRQIHEPERLARERREARAERRKLEEERRQHSIEEENRMLREMVNRLQNDVHKK